MNNEEAILLTDDEKLFNMVDSHRVDDFIDILFDELSTDTSP